MAKYNICISINNETFTQELTKLVGTLNNDGNLSHIQYRKPHFNPHITILEIEVSDDNAVQDIENIIHCILSNIRKLNIDHLHFQKLMRLGTVNEFGDTRCAVLTCSETTGQVLLKVRKYVKHELQQQLKEKNVAEEKTDSRSSGKQNAYRIIEHDSYKPHVTVAWVDTFQNEDRIDESLARVSDQVDISTQADHISCDRYGQDKPKFPQKAIRTEKFPEDIVKKLLSVFSEITDRDNKKNILEINDEIIRFNNLAREKQQLKGLESYKEKRAKLNEIESEQYVLLKEIEYRYNQILQNSKGLKGVNIDALYHLKNLTKHLLTKNQRIRHLRQRYPLKEVFASREFMDTRNIAHLWTKNSPLDSKSDDAKLDEEKQPDTSDFVNAWRIQSDGIALLARHQTEKSDPDHRPWRVGYYQTLNERYGDWIGTDQEKNLFDWAKDQNLGEDSNKFIVYLDQQQSLQHLVTTSYDQNEEKVLAYAGGIDNKFHVPDGEYIYVMDTQGNFFIGKEGGIDGENDGRRLQHPSFVAGERILSGGTITIKGGKIIAINDNSGHYQTSAAELAITVIELSRRGWLSKDCIVKSEDRRTYIFEEDGVTIKQDTFSPDEFVARVSQIPDVIQGRREEFLKPQSYDRISEKFNPIHFEKINQNLTKRASETRTGLFRFFGYNAQDYHNRKDCWIEILEKCLEYEDIQDSKDEHIHFKDALLTLLDKKISQFNHGRRRNFAQGLKDLKKSIEIQGIDHFPLQNIKKYSSYYKYQTEMERTLSSQGDKNSIQKEAASVMFRYSAFQHDQARDGKVDSSFPASDELQSLSQRNLQK